MSAPKKRRSSRYDVSGNVEAEYVDAEKIVLANKKGITDLRTLQIAEEESLAAAYASLLAELRLDTPMTCALLRHDWTEEGSERYLQAAGAAFKRDYAPMAELIREALQRSARAT